jgi:2-oxoglutarate ferredoxin oxidoreductase subunit beta
MGSTSIADFVPEKTEITATVAPGENKFIEMHDGSLIHLTSLAAGWDPKDRLSAINAIHNANRKGEVLTGLLYVNADQPEVHKLLNTVDTPLNALPQEVLMPSIGALDEINASFM